MIQAILVFSVASVLIAGYHNACSQIYQYSINKTLLTAQQIKRRWTLVAFIIVGAVVLIVTCIVIDFINSSTRTIFVRQLHVSSIAISIVSVLFAALCFHCRWLITAAKVRDMHNLTLNLQMIAVLLGFSLAVLAFLVIIVAYSTQLQVQLIALCLQCLIFFASRVLLFILCTQFSPGFTIKSNLNERQAIEIIGLNIKGYEMFKFEIPDTPPFQTDQFIHTGINKSNSLSGSFLREDSSDSSVEESEDNQITMTKGSPTQHRFQL